MLLTWRINRFSAIDLAAALIGNYGPRVIRLITLVKSRLDIYWVVESPLCPGGLFYDQSHFIQKSRDAITFNVSQS
jgi:hypothetical protein